MKKFLVRCLVNDGPLKGQLLGYVGRDNPSGGYPYSSPDLNFIQDHYAKSYMEWVAEKTEMSTYNTGSKSLPLDVGIFLGDYRKKHQLPVRTYPQIALRFELLELDVSDALFIESKILQIIEVEGRGCEDYKTQDQAFYRIVSNQSFN